MRYTVAKTLLFATGFASLKKLLLSLRTLCCISHYLPREGRCSTLRSLPLEAINRALSFLYSLVRLRIPTVNQLSLRHPRQGVIFYDRLFQVVFLRSRAD